MQIFSFCLDIDFCLSKILEQNLGRKSLYNFGTFIHDMEDFSSLKKRKDILLETKKIL
jgi:hypothetical protein